MKWIREFFKKRSPPKKLVLTPEQITSPDSDTLKVIRDIANSGKSYKFTYSDGNVLVEVIDQE